VPFHPYYTVKDGFAASVFVIMFAIFVFFMPEALGHVDNNIPANPIATPAHIVPEWYLLPYYAILRAVPNKVIGVFLMGAAIACIFALPWLDTSRVRSMRYRPQAKLYFWIFVVDCILLGFCGAHEPDEPFIRGVSGFLLGDSNINSYVWVSRIASAYYFAYFVLITPILGLRETPLPAPESISSPVLSHPAGAPSRAAAAPEKKG
jgi:ubiquinol-cytochrome c reductase cytochrome b/c1 subunit